MAGATVPSAASIASQYGCSLAAATLAINAAAPAMFLLPSFGWAYWIAGAFSGTALNAAWKASGKTAKIIAAAFDQNCNTYSESDVYAAKQQLQQWIAPGGLANPYAGMAPAYADQWKAAYDQNHQSFFGQAFSDVGNALGGAVAAVGNALGGSGNFVGQSLDAAGGFVAQAAYTIGNDPGQAAVDAAEGLPGAVLDVATAGAAITADVVGSSLSAIGSATGNAGLTRAGNAVTDVVGDTENATVGDPVASLMVIGGTVGTIFGGVGSALLAAGLGKLVDDVAGKASTDPNIVGATQVTPGGAPKGTPSPVAGHHSDMLYFAGIVVLALAVFAIVELT